MRCRPLHSCWLLVGYAVLYGLAQCEVVATDEATEKQAEAEVQHFEKSVRPLLINRCFKCHAVEEPKAGLRLDSIQGLVRGGETGPAIVVGKPDESLLIKAVRHEGGAEMPPDGKLSDQEIADLATWIATGAVWPDDAKVQLPAADSPQSISPIEPNHTSLAPYLQVWYKAESISVPNGDRVSSWPDASGNGRDLTPTLGVRPDGAGTAPKFIGASTVNRRPAVRFGIGDGLAAAPENPVAIQGNAQLSIVLVMNLEPVETQPPSEPIICVGNPAYSSDPGQPLAALVQIDRGHDHQLSLAGGWGHDASLGPGSFKPLYGRPVILSIVKSPGPMADTTRIFINGEPSTAPPHERAVIGDDAIPDIQHRADSGVWMGKALRWSGNLRGDMSEAVIYNIALNDSQRAALEWQLAEKYAITLASQVRATRSELSPAEKLHWAFQPVVDRSPPAVADESWIRSPVDRFILSGLEARGLKPSPPADKRVLIRRVTFDLTGLPPAPDEIGAFLKDESPGAFVTVVNRLLDSPHYGERWGRHWLDVVRYAETTANDANCVMRYAYRYRDYVVDAFNRDLPYDQFIVEQLAGDLLPATTDINQALRQVIATGYLLLGPKALAETDKEQSRLDIVDDQIDVTGRAFLGLTLACARCHDHKFDPIPAVDYYALAGIFRSTEPFMDEVRNATMWWEFPLFEAPGEKPFIVMAPKETTPRNLRVHLRGNRFTLGKLAPRGFLQVLSSGSRPLETSQSGRLELARWIARRDNPLTARVMVNRVWQHHFGAGLVTTSDNFGARGTTPSHPELLDYLAARFVDNGWSLKALHRIMVVSSTYQQRSSPDHPGASIDPENRLLWRMPRRRLEAEALRDSLLAVSGKLDRRLGGNEGAEELYKAADKLDEKRGFVTNALQANHPCYDVPRRSLYLPVVRNALPDVLALFDAADPNGVTPARNDTTVPSQALFMLNNPFVRNQSLEFAKRLLSDAKATDADRIDRAYILAFGRPPEPDEVASATEYLAHYMAAPATRARPEPEWRTTAWQSLCQILFCSNEFLYLE